MEVKLFASRVSANAPLASWKWLNRFEPLIWLWKLRSIVLALGALSSLAACDQHAPDGLSIANAVHPVREIGDRITSADLTDATAIVKRLKDVEKASPPQDFSSPKSVADRRAFYVSARNKALGAKPSFLLPITCTAGTDPYASMTYEPSSKNVGIRIFTGSKVASDEAETISKLLLDEVQLYSRDAVLLAETGETLLSDHEPERQIPADANDHFRDTGSIQLLNGPTIDVVNSETRSAVVRMKLALATAAFEHSKLVHAHLQGDRADPRKQLAPLLQEEIRWVVFPDAQLPRPFWSNTIPYAGDPSHLCLIGQFYNPDLIDGEGLTVFGNPAASFAAQITSWYLIDRTSGHVIAIAKNPNGVEG